MAPIKKSRSARPLKESRINFRVPPEKADQWREAALKHKQTLTKFIEESTDAVAACELAMQHEFSMPLDRWKAFLEILDRPPQAPPGLRRLLTELSPLELAHQTKK